MKVVLLLIVFSVLHSFSHCNKLQASSKLTKRIEYTSKKSSISRNHNHNHNHKDKIAIKNHEIVAIARNNIEVDETLQILSTKSTTPLLKSSTARIALILCAFCYGSTYIITIEAQKLLDPSIVTTLRFLIAAILFLPAIIRGVIRGIHVKTDLWLLVGSIELGILCAIGFFSQGMILQSTSASKASLFCGLSVLMPPVFDLIASKTANRNKNDNNNNNKNDDKSKLNSTNESDNKKVKNKSIVKQSDSININPLEAIVIKEKYHFKMLLNKIVKSPFIQPLLALCGALILEWDGTKSPKLSDLSLLITPISFAMCLWRSEQLGAIYQNEAAEISGIMIFTVAIIGVFWSIITTFITCYNGSSLLLEYTKLSTVLNDRKVIFSLFYSGILTTAVTAYVEQEALQVLSAKETTLIYALEPLFATVFAAVYLKDRITLTTLKGAFFIIIACLWNTIIEFINSLFINSSIA